MSGSVVVLAVMLAACSPQPDGDRAAPTEEPSLASTAEPAALECELEGYACTYEEVPAETVARSDTLAREALAMAVDGASTAEAADWLRAQDDMAEVEADDLAIRFRLTGGRGTWVLRSDQLTRGAPGRTVDPVAAPLTPTAPLGAVVGGASIDDRRALVLSPMKHDFGSEDEGAEVADMLRDTRGYGTVDYVENAELYDTDVNPSSFLGWDRYQVVHVATHGVNICDPRTDDPCRAGLGSHIIGGRLDAEDGLIDAEGFKEVWRELGAELAVFEDTRGLELEAEATVVLVTADFFRAAYGNGLEETLVYFSACEANGDGASTDIVQALRGETSVVIGWDTTVESLDAQAAALAVYEQLIKGGWTVGTALDRIGVLRTDCCGGQLLSSGRRAGGDLRIRHVVTVLDPGSGCPMSSVEQPVTVEGELGDGEPDSYPYRVLVEGMSKEVAEQAIFRIWVRPSLDIALEVERGVPDPRVSAIEPVPVSSGTDLDDGMWELRGVMPLGHDVKSGLDTQFTEAWVELPDDDESSDIAAATPYDETFADSYDDIDPCEPGGTPVARTLPASQFDPDVPLLITYEYLRGGAVSGRVDVAWKDGNISKTFFSTDLNGSAQTASNFRWVRGPAVEEGFCDISGDNGCLPLAGARPSPDRNAFLPGGFGEVPAFQGRLPALAVTGPRTIAGVAATCGIGDDEEFGEVALCIEESTGAVLYVHTVGRCELGEPDDRTCVEVEATSLGVPESEDFALPL